MELPRRSRGDELLKPGELLALRARLRNLSRDHDLATVIACAFDHRTRMLPFIYADMHMVPAGVRAIASAMLDAGFHKTRIVLQQWNRNFRPSEMRLDGRIPDLFMVSSMQIHTAECKALIHDVCRIDPGRRPLIIAGGAKAIYEPWDVFSADPRDRWGADVAVTGEEYVLLSLLEVLLSIRGRGEPLRSAFMRARDGGMLDEIPGLVYARTDLEGVPEELVDTGVQRLVGDLDELPHPVLGYSVLEPPSRKITLGAAALPTSAVRRHSRLASLVLTFGCKFACPYCPIPAYNQRQHRVKSGERIADEMVRLADTYGIRYFFGADDNFFNDHDRTLDILGTVALARRNHGGKRYRFQWGTEVTVHDALKMKDNMRLVRSAGIRALWLGVEDMTATLVKKGQSVDKTTEAFAVLRRYGICPMPMMMHHDTQPLLTRGDHPYGLLNQIRVLRKAGAISLQVLMITPATGSRIYDESYSSGLVYRSAGGRQVQAHMLDGNYVVASRHPRPWRKQLNLMIAYLYFYNPLRMAWALVRPKSRLYLADAGMQVIGMWGLTQTIRRTLGWAGRLRGGGIARSERSPASLIPMRGPDGQAASHALPGTPGGSPVPLTVSASSSRP
ncbi:MAG TPA: radical SAM protein [Phycisphaerae bacterium]|nr:radical SAM protein [Phycisphaerae bacterium]HRY68948.1 radical SAM protein [Phycisphaerae bacterium]HSA25775.1 radical SAM protein [Phycisphaerae bacterium]